MMKFLIAPVLPIAAALPLRTNSQVHLSISINTCTKLMVSSNSSFYPVLEERIDPRLGTPEQQASAIDKINLSDYKQFDLAQHPGSSTTTGWDSKRDVTHPTIPTLVPESIDDDVVSESVDRVDTVTVTVTGSVSTVTSHADDAPVPTLQARHGYDRVTAVFEALKGIAKELPTEWNAYNVRPSKARPTTSSTSTLATTTYEMEEGDVVSGVTSTVYPGPRASGVDYASQFVSIVESEASAIVAASHTSLDPGWPEVQRHYTAPPPALNPSPVDNDHSDVVVIMEADVDFGDDDSEIWTFSYPDVDLIRTPTSDAILEAKAKHDFVAQITSLVDFEAANGNENVWMSSFSLELTAAPVVETTPAAALEPPAAPASEPTAAPTLEVRGNNDAISELFDIAQSEVDNGSENAWITTFAYPVDEIAPTSAPALEVGDAKHPLAQALEQVEKGRDEIREDDHYCYVKRPNQDMEQECVTVEQDEVGPIAAPALEGRDPKYTLALAFEQVDESLDEIREDDHYRYVQRPYEDLEQEHVTVMQGGVVDIIPLPTLEEMAMITTAPNLEEREVGNPEDGEWTRVTWDFDQANPPPGFVWGPVANSTHEIIGDQKEQPLNGEIFQPGEGPIKKISRPKGQLWAQRTRLPGVYAYSRWLMTPVAWPFNGHVPITTSSRGANPFTLNRFKDYIMDEVVTRNRGSIVTFETVVPDTVVSPSAETTLMITVMAETGTVESLPVETTLATKKVTSRIHDCETSMTIKVPDADHVPTKTSHTPTGTSIGGTNTYIILAGDSIRSETANKTISTPPIQPRSPERSLSYEPHWT